jgi:hypothetical protein
MHRVDLLLYLRSTDEITHRFHHLYRLQVSTYGGKIAGSEAYVAVDARLPGDDCGMSVHSFRTDGFRMDVSLEGNNVALTFLYRYTGPHSLQV